MEVKDLITVHRLNKEHFLVNCELIEFVEETPDTVISMVSGRKVVVSEKCEEIKNMIIEYKQQIIFSSKFAENDTLENTCD